MIAPAPDDDGPIGTRASGRSPSRERGYWGDACSELARDRAAMIGLGLVIVLVMAAVASSFWNTDPNFQHRFGLSDRGEPVRPFGDHWLGTDYLGRDELARLLAGARVSLIVGIGANVVGAIVGVVIGGMAGMAGRRGQTALMRLVDVVLGFPILLLAIALLTVTQPSIVSIVLIIGISFGAYLSRLVFTQVVSLRERDFVLAAQISGVRFPAILVRHILPHVVPSVIVYATLGVATAILLEAALSFVGIGIQPPEASWGNMISDGEPFLLSAPWLVIFPGVAIMLAMFGFSLLGDGLRDALDPTLDRRSNLVTRGVR